MFSIASLWIPFTITAALGQVARNAMQRSLTGPLGTWGATNIRFLFGFPFSSRRCGQADKRALPS